MLPPSKKHGPPSKETSAIGSSMKIDDRVVTHLPLTDLFDANGPVAAERVVALGVQDIQEMLRRGPCRFVFAEGGRPLTWTEAATCFATWAHEVRPHLAAPESKNNLDEFPGAYLYFASAWRLQDGEEIVVLEMHH